MAEFMPSDPNIMPDYRPDVVGHIKEVAQRFGRFMFGAIDAETAYPSEHRRIPEPQDGEALEPNLNGYGEIADSLRG